VEKNRLVRFGDRGCGQERIDEEQKRIIDLGKGKKEQGKTSNQDLTLTLEWKRGEVLLSGLHRHMVGMDR
jgi:hypothetical protein